jgi:hypothetical protein
MYIIHDIHQYSGGGKIIKVPKNGLILLELYRKHLISNKPPRNIFNEMDICIRNGP